MEDDKSTETSTNEEALDTESDLSESDINFDDAEDTSEEDETEESSESEEDESANESTDEDQEESEEDADEETKGEDPEAQRRDAARKAFEQREAARLAKEKSKREAQDKYLQDAEDNHDLALRQLQIDAYNNRVQNNTNKLQNDLDKAAAHIDLLKTGSPEVKEALLEAVDEFEAMYVVKDGNGDPVEVKGDLFAHLQKKADSIRRLTGVGERKAKQDKGKTKSRTLSAPSRAPKQAKTDPDLEGFDEEADRW